MRTPQMKLLIALAAIGVTSAFASPQWEPVVSGKGERIELDKSRVGRPAEHKALAWTRLALDRDMVDEYGQRYTAIEALNSYDCDNRSFATVKRVYRRDGKQVRVEDVANVREILAKAGSADELLLTEACKLRLPGEGRRVAEPTARTAAESRDDKPTIMFADMRSADNGNGSKIVKVSDKPAEAKPADPKAAEPKPADAAAKPGERPRFFDLPKIDKSNLEDPMAGAAKPAEAKPADAKAAPKPADAKAPAKAAAVKAYAEPPPERSVGRQELERLYATSGPPRKARKKVEETVVEHHDIHWSYEGEGAPANWGKLRSDYATCANGRRQSPIDIREGIKVDLEPIQFDYKQSRFNVLDNGHTIQVNVSEGSSIAVLGRQFQLVQFHFHRPSEERINGRGFDMVAHFVHKDDDGNLGVVAVLLEKGMEHPLIQTVWNNLPLERNSETMPAAVIDLNQMLPPPDQRNYYTYMGSLTTPPCSENVLWMVLKKPLQISPQQVAIFSRLYSNNARPIQPSNGRLVKENR